MKTKLGSLKKNLLASIRSDAQFQQMLTHILSPVELEAFKNDFQGFRYNFNGAIYVIEPQHGKTLLNVSLTKIRLFSDILVKTNRKLLGDSAGHRKFLSREIKSLDLPAYLKNNLRRQGCKNLFDVMDLGKQRIAKSRGIGKAGIKTLEKLFEKNGCGILFS